MCHWRLVFSSTYPYIEGFLGNFTTCPTLLKTMEVYARTERKSEQKYSGRSTLYTHKPNEAA